MSLSPWSKGNVSWFLYLKLPAWEDTLESSLYKVCLKLLLGTALQHTVQQLHNGDADYQGQEGQD